MSVELFGHGQTARIVDVSIDRDACQALLYVRGEDDRVVVHRRGFHPFMFVKGYQAEKAAKHALRGPVHVKRLAGSHPYDHALAFDSVMDFFVARKAILKVRGDDAVFATMSMEQQYLMQSGETLFGSMTFDDAHRLQLDIETYSENGTFPNAERPEDRIIIVSLSDNRGFDYVFHLRQYDGENPERDMLADVFATIRDLDPDIIELHNGFGFDLPYIATRCRMFNLPFAIGRDGSEPRTYPSRKRAAERWIEYTVFECQGRHIIDTMFAAYDYDVFARDMPGYSLKVAAQYFGVAPEDRTYIAGQDIADAWDDDPDKLLAYALDDVVETRGIAEHLCQSNFYLAQMLPMRYEAIARRGSGAKIEALFTREYLRQGHSIPTPEPARRYEGGLTDLYQRGVLGPIVYADVASLYPSIMLNFDVRPETDTLNIFGSLLRDLTKLRFEWKAASKAADDPRDAGRFKGMEKSAKIVINSFYGVLGYQYFPWNSYDEADRVTRIGRYILRWMVTLIEEQGGTVVEIDTDGVMFIPPEHVGPSDEAAFVRALTDRMPEGIKIDYDGRADKMMSYKSKNYALREGDKLKIKGGALISRQYEPFLTEFIEEGIRKLLDDDMEGLHRLYRRTYEALETRTLPVEKLTKAVELKDSIAEYRASVERGHGNGGRHVSAPYELAIKRWEEGGRRPKVGDKIKYYLAGDEHRISYIKGYEHAKLYDPECPEQDYNVVYYIKRRLKSATEKFRPFFTEEDFGTVFNHGRVSSDRLSSVYPVVERVKDPEFYRWNPADALRGA